MSNKETWENHIDLSNWQINHIDFRELSANAVHIFSGVLEILRNPAVDLPSHKLPPPVTLGDAQYIARIKIIKAATGSKYHN